MTAEVIWRSCRMRPFRLLMTINELSVRSASSFVVEYKNTRRKGIEAPKSIWGNLDLSSVVGQLEKEALPLPGGGVKSHADRDHVLTEGEPTPPSLLSRPAELTTAPVVEEIRMVEENEIAADVANDAEGIPPTQAEEPTQADDPKQGRGRRKANAAEPSRDELAASAANQPRTRRGRPKAAKSKADAGRGRERAKAAAEEQPDLPSSEIALDLSAPVEEVDDLLQLEQENQRLRRLLAEKLREENASLRQRLGLD